jgi:hypothetical protein
METACRSRIGPEKKETPMSKKTARVPRIDPAAAEVERLRDYHHLGQKLLEEFPERAKYGQGAMRRRAEELGVGVNHLVHLRLFAVHYSDRALAKLLAQRSPAGRPLSWSHLRLLVNVNEPQLRTSLQAAAACEGWPVARLREAIRIRQGRRHGGGRRLRRPSTVEGGLLQLAERGDLLRRYLALFALGDDPVLVPGKRPRKAEDRQRRRDMLDRATETLTGLRREIGRVLDTLGQARKELEQDSRG